MRLTTVLLIATLLQVSATTFGQRITINERKASFEKVLKSIRAQSGYDVLMDRNILKNTAPINVSIKDATIDEAMKSLLEGLPLKYSIDGKIVVIEEKAPSFLDRVIDRLVAIDVRGRVVDASGEGLQGATVKVKGTNKSVVTNGNGEFYLQNVDEGAVLMVSYIGYKPVEVGAQKELGSIKLEITDNQLDQVQVIAYGTTTRRFTTSNIGSVKAADIKKQPVTNPLLALQGRIPGLIISQQTGIAGGDVQVQIQGKNSIQNGNDPFYVIDGVPFNSRTLPSTTGIFAGSGNSPFSYLNPADIESIEVLKDADATSIYGSRAANGAILITTKKGKQGKAQVAVDLQQGWGRVPRKMDLLNTAQYLEIRKEAKRNDKAAISQTDYDINGVWDSTRNEDWQKELIGNTAHFSNMQATLSGGNKETQFLVGAGYIRETAVFPGDFADTKGSVNFNIQYISPNEKFRIQLSGNYLSGNNQLINSDLTSVALSLAPNAPSIFNADGTLNWGILPTGTTSFVNPASRIVQNYENRTNNLISNAILSYQVIPGLSLKSSFGYNKVSTKELRITPITFYNPNALSRIRNAYYGDKSNTAIIVEPQIEYRKAFSFGHVNFLAGATYSENNSELTGLNGSGYNSDMELANIRSASAVTVANAIQSKYRYNAAFGRLTYDYKSRYILNLSARRDGSSRFGAENQFHNFYSAGAAWIFSEETFTQNSIPVLNYGKLRLSYGTTGNDQIGDYAFLSLFDPVSAGVAYQGASGLNAGGHANPLLQWELTKKFNAGIDLGVLSNRFLLNLNYFINTSSNQLLFDPLPIQTGFELIKRNFPATVRNSGLEVQLNVQVVKAGDFTWSSNLNLTVPKNKLVAFPNLASNPNASNQYIIGEPVSIIKAYRFAGVNPQTGAYEFFNSNNERTGSPNSITDKTAIMNTDSKFYGGWHNSFSYKGFELDLLCYFNRQTGYDPYTRFGYLVTGYFNTNQPVSALNRWRAAGDMTQQQRANSNLSLLTATSNASISDAAYTDASFISLKNVALSYTLPKAWTSRLYLNSINVFTQGQNLFMITRFKGLNPEASSATVVPPLRIISMGLRVNL